MKRAEKGFTLVEIVFVAAISAFILVGMIHLYILTSVQSEVAGKMTLAVSEAQNKLEEIRNTPYSEIATDYASGGTPGNTFDLTLLEGKGVIYIDSSNPELLGLEVVVCWKDKYDRVIGEDLNLNGMLDDGEDSTTSGTLGKIDSPVILKTMITRR